MRLGLGEKESGDAGATRERKARWNVRIDKQYIFETLLDHLSDFVVYKGLRYFVLSRSLA